MECFYVLFSCSNLLLYNDNKAFYQNFPYSRKTFKITKKQFIIRGNGNKGCKETGITVEEVLSNVHPKKEDSTQTKTHHLVTGLKSVIKKKKHSINHCWIKIQLVLCECYLYVKLSQPRMNKKQTERKIVWNIT